MSLNVGLFLEAPWILLGLTALYIAVKVTALWIMAKATGFCHGFAARFGLTLAQGSEFTFVLFALAASQGLMAPALAQLLSVVVGLTMALTPALATLGGWVSRRLEKYADAPRDPETETSTSEKQVVITGFDTIGEKIARILHAEGIRYIGLSNDREQVADFRSKGFHVDFSDPNRPKTFGLAAAQKTSVSIVLMDNSEIALMLADTLREVDPTLPVYAATSDLKLFEALGHKGLTDVFVKNDETASLIAHQILHNHYGKTEEETVSRLEAIQREETNYLVNAV